MSLFEKNRNLIFWTLQFAGWGFLNMTSVIFLEKLGARFVVFSVLTGLTVGIGTSTALRYYLKKNVSLENFNFQKFVKIALSVLIASAIYFLLSYGLGYGYGKLSPEIDDAQIEVLKALDNFWLLVFNSIFIMVCWVICYLVIKLLLRLNKDRMERLQLSDTLKQAQLNTLKGQINPHFMFNSLNNIRGLMLEDVEKSREMLTKLSEMLRYSLTKNSVDGIALEEELEMVENYIALSKIQFEDRLQFEKEIPQDTLTVQIPPMILQFLVENAAKHGISNLKEGGTIALSSQLNGEALYLQVSNTGRLSIANGSTQLGIKNIRQRLKLLYGDKASFHLKEENNEVVATVKIPIS